MFSAASTSTQPNQQQPSIFGAPLVSTPSQAPATGANLFGGQTQQQQNATQPNAGGGLFGNLGQTGQAGGSIFSTTQTAPQAGTSGGFFGNTNQGGAGAAGGSIFGTANNATAGATPGSLFGNTNTNAGGATGTNPFGSATTAPAANTGSLFGNTNTAPNAQPAVSNPFGNTSTAAGGTLFGNTNNTATAPAAGTGGSLFGNTNTANTGGNLFGNTSNAAASNTGSSLFGSTNNPASGGNLFGNTSTAGTSTAGGSLFGNTNPSNPGTNIFGNTNTNATQQQPSGSIFGSTQQQQQAPAGNLFPGFQSNQQRPAQQGSLFSGPSNTAGSTLYGGSMLGSSTLGGSTLGMSTLSGLPSIKASMNPLLASRAAVLSQQQQDPQSQFAFLTQRVEAIIQAWSSSSPNCQFQHFFYNLVDPAQVHLYGRPANATNDVLWQKAVQANPDPSCFVPVVASGFDDLQQRVEAQTKQATTHQETLKELQTRIKALTEKHDVTTTARLTRVASLQTQLTQRVMRVVQHLHLLIPTLRSSSIRAEEEALRATLEAIAEDIKGPGGFGKMRGKLNELWALVGALNAAKDRDRKDSGRGWAVVDEDGLAQIAQILANEQAGLAHVMKVLQRDLKDLNVIEGKPNKEQDPDSLLMSSLRGAPAY